VTFRSVNVTARARRPLAAFETDVVGIESSGVRAV
jgi:hypothetical protein